MSLKTVGVLPLLALAAPTFGVYASIAAELAAEVTALIAISIEIGIVPPEIGIAFAIAVQLTLALNIALSIGVPSVNVGFQFQFSLEIAVLIGLVGALSAALAVGDIGLEVLTYAGVGTTLGAAVGGLVAGGWSDGTDPNADVTVAILAATSAPAIAALQGFFNGAVFSGAQVLGTLGLSGICVLDFQLLLGLFGEFSARLSAMLKASVNLGLVPPSVAASIEFVAKLDASLQAAIHIGMPSISAKFAASIEARIALIASLSAQVAAALELATEGFDVFVYTGPGSGLGPALTSQLTAAWPDGAAPGVPCNVMLLGATKPEAVAALTTFFPPIAA